MDDTLRQMNDERFWGFIDQARAESNASADPKLLETILDKSSTEEILDFGHMLYTKICDLNQWRLWGAGYLINGGMSDDSFHYFRTWIVGKGKNAFETAMTNPDDLGLFVEEGEDVDNELLEYVPVELLEARGMDEDPLDRTERRADQEPSGEPFDEETVAASFPKLAARFA